jgi:hypothetical protein
MVLIFFGLTNKDSKTFAPSLPLCVKKIRGKRS